VVTTVHGRHAHLRRQLDGLAASGLSPDLHVVVALADPGAAAVVGAGAVVVSCDGDPAALPLARARNTGAEAALQAGAELLVFLDVDCIPGRDLMARYAHTAAHPDHHDALLCGPVTYLPPAGPGGYRPGDLQENPHPARPAPAGDEVLVGSDYQLFWSLSFALAAPTWRRIGGFCELYRGYGGEDTDFAQSAAAAGVGLRWVGGAHAFHQHHPVSKPPVQHLHDIVRNAQLFHQRWGWWPMTGWLDAFEARGLIERDADGRPVSVSGPASVRSS
jgi:GT2 family glycosyltransferase